MSLIFYDLRCIWHYATIFQCFPFDNKFVQLSIKLRYKFFSLNKSLGCNGKKGRKYMVRVPTLILLPQYLTNDSTRNFLMSTIKMKISSVLPFWLICKHNMEHNVNISSMSSSHTSPHFLHLFIHKNCTPTHLYTLR